MAFPRESQARALQLRAFELAARIILLSRRLSRSDEARIIRSQLLRSATATAANYRSACRAQSARAFVAKLSIALEEADEVILWLRLLVRVGLAAKLEVRPLITEADELVRIFSASRRTMLARKKQLKSNCQSSIVNRQ
jgi:four helix bundle protein